MAKSSVQYKCSNCGHVEAKWAGQCPECGEFGTFEETAVAFVSSGKSSGSLGTSSGKTGYRASKVATGNVARPVKDIAAQTDTRTRFVSGINELDRVLGDGFMPGGVVLLSAFPGVGKSTLSLWTASEFAKQGKKVLYISGEESANQIAARALRIGAADEEPDNDLGESLYLVSEGNLQNAIQQFLDVQPDFLVVDSVQTLISDDSESRLGSVTHVMEVASDFTNIAKRLNIPTILIGHMTKDGTVSGPQTLGHLVDVVLTMEKEDDSDLIILRATKNRFGATDELGIFRHTSNGLEEVSDPSGVFMDAHEEGTNGFAISITIDGKRAFPVEVQALVSPTKLPNPRKISTGIEHSRALQIQAVVDKHVGLRLFDQDVYVSATGGLRLRDSGTDMALVAALISARTGIPMSADEVFLGEVSLTGELRSPRNRERRIKEAGRLFSRIYTTPGKKVDTDAEIIFVRSVYDLGAKIKQQHETQTRIRPSLMQETLENVLTEE